MKKKKARSIDGLEHEGAGSPPSTLYSRTIYYTLLITLLSTILPCLAIVAILRRLMFANIA